MECNNTSMPVNSSTLLVGDTRQLGPVTFQQDHTQSDNSDVEDTRVVIYGEGGSLTIHNGEEEA